MQKLFLALFTLLISLNVLAVENPSYTNQGQTLNYPIDHLGECSVAPICNISGDVTATENVTDHHSYWRSDLCPLNEVAKYLIFFYVDGNGTFECKHQCSSPVMCDDGEKAVISLLPAPGWKFKKLLVDNVDVTDQVVGNQYCIEHVKTGHAMGAFFVEDLGEASMEPVLNDHVQVTAYNGAINVIGAEPGTKISIRDINGNIIVATQTTQAHQSIPMNKPGVFIVNVNDTTYRVAL